MNIWVPNNLPFHVSFSFIYQACVNPQLGSHGLKEEGRREWQISLLTWSVSLRRVRIISLRHSLFIVFVLWQWPRRDYWDKQIVRWNRWQHCPPPTCTVQCTKRIVSEVRRLMQQEQLSRLWTMFWSTWQPKFGYCEIMMSWASFSQATRYNTNISNCRNRPVR